MKKEFVPNEQALELKELGFDEQCLGYYDTEGLKISSDWYLNPQNKNSLFPEPHTTNNPKISAPLYQQAFRWFREKHDMQTLIKKNKSDHVWYRYEVYFERLATGENPPVMVGHTINSWLGLNLEFNTYEEAEEACLDKLILMTKTKN